MLRRKLHESLTVRIFLITLLILLGAGAITFALIAWATPITYTAAASDDLRAQTDLLVERLSVTALEDCGPILSMRVARASICLGRREGAAAPYRYEGVVRDAILRAKYEGESWTAVELGVEMTARLFGAKVEMHFAEPVPGPVAGAAVGYDCIIPVPASSRRRGYNVPERMARPLSHALGLPLLPKALCRARAGRHQAGLSLEERLVNVAGAFRAQEPELVEGKRVLLVDDVITTGATAAACAQALLDAGAHSVFAVALAASGGEMDATSNASEA